jgi:7-cyano-7-deazaguanine reductase
MQSSTENSSRRRNMTDLAKDLQALGTTTTYAYDKPDASLLEWFPNPMLPECENRIEISAPEFTSLCPKTGQPDFAEICIVYRPNERCVESKSLKLYLGSFRMFGEFHEACVARITSDLANLLEPRYLRVEGHFSPRGGIKFWPVSEFIA